MNDERLTLLQTIRDIANKKGVGEISLEKLRQNKAIPNDLLNKYYTKDIDLVTDILTEERKKFEEIFVDHDFDGYYDAIDILFTVSKEMAGKFFSLSPSVTYVWKDVYPEVYQEHIQKRIDFIYMKINVNLQKGIMSGFYRNDVSTELVARRYISRLLDLHDPDNFPPEEFSFLKLFDQMFESFVKSIATEEGLAHYEKKKKSAKF
ncbi:MAG: hypothetical protein C0591_00630 [Marinilabiliales bacterium]|jgi:hypothetical protein|nr:MAG: hypothetical protein C0591_00630 [Marinilabiliales bacterium]